MAVHCVLRTSPRIFLGKKNLSNPCPLQHLVFAHLFKVTAEALSSGGNSEAKTASKYHWHQRKKSSVNRQAHSCAWPSSWTKILPRASVCINTSMHIHIIPPHAIWSARSGLVSATLACNRNNDSIIHFVPWHNSPHVGTDCCNCALVSLGHFINDSLSRLGATVLLTGRNWRCFLALVFVPLCLSDQRTDPWRVRISMTKYDNTQPSYLGNLEEGMCGLCAEKKQ